MGGRPLWLRSPREPNTIPPQGTACAHRDHRWMDLTIRLRSSLPHHTAACSGHGLACRAWGYKGTGVAHFPAPRLASQPASWPPGHFVRVTRLRPSGGEGGARRRSKQQGAERLVHRCLRWSLLLLQSPIRHFARAPLPLAPPTSRLSASEPTDTMRDMNYQGQARKHTTHTQAHPWANDRTRTLLDFPLHT